MTNTKFNTTALLLPVVVAILVAGNYEAAAFVATTGSGDGSVRAAAKATALRETADVSVPYDAATRLAYESSNKSVPYEEFKTRYEADAVAAIKLKVGFVDESAKNWDPYGMKASAKRGGFDFANGYIGGEGPELVPGSIDGATSVNFDPLGFAERSPEWLPWYREAELKHGRAAMLATVGFVAPEMFRIPGEQFSFESVPKVIDAHDALPNSMILIFAGISFIEACTIPALANMGGYDREPGDYGFDPLGLFPKDPAKQKERRLQELKNGRLAMISIGGMVAGAAVTGKGFPYLPLM